MRRRVRLALLVGLVVGWAVGCNDRVPDFGLDLVRPEVGSVVPPDASQDADLAVELQANFSEPMEPSTVSADTFLVRKSDGAAIAGTAGIVNTTATFRPSARLEYLTDYVATLTTGMQDQVGRSLAASATWQFQTRDLRWTVEQPVTPPLVISRPGAVVFRTPEEAFAVVAQQNAGRYDFWWSTYSLGSGFSTPVLFEQDDSGGTGTVELVAATGGVVLAVWTQSDGTRMNLWSNRYVPELGWTGRLGVESDDTGDVNTFAVDVDDAGNAVCVWRQFNGSQWNLWASRFTPGDGWTTAVALDNQSTIVTYLDLAVAPNGDAIAIWQQSGGTYQDVWYNRLVGATWQGAQNLDNHEASDTLYPRVIIDPTGIALAFWIQENSPAAASLKARAYSPVGGWSPSVAPIGNSDGNFFDAAFAPDGSAIAIYVLTDPLVAVNVLARRFTSQGGWEAPVTLGSHPFDAIVVRPQIELDARGNGVAIWEDQSFDGTPNVMASRFLIDVGWSAPLTVATGSTAVISLSEKGNGVMTWGDVISKAFE